MKLWNELKPTDTKEEIVRKLKREDLSRQVIAGLLIGAGMTLLYKAGATNTLSVIANAMVDDPEEKQG